MLLLQYSLCARGQLILSAVWSANFACRQDHGQRRLRWVSAQYNSPQERWYLLRTFVLDGQSQKWYKICESMRISVSRCAAQ